MMKKTICIMLTAMMMVMPGAAVFAETDENSFTETYETNGMTLTYTDAFSDVKGIFEPYPMGEVMDGICLTQFLYMAIEPDRFDELMSKGDEASEEETLEVSSSTRLLGLEVSVDGGRTSSDIIEALGIGEITEDAFTEIGKDGDVTFYAVDIPEDPENPVPEEFADEYSALHDALFEEVLGKGEYFAPIEAGADLVGTKISFETTDVDGNQVSSEEIFASHDVTMVNIWATWCHFCVEELPELAEMDHRIAEKNAAIIGICTDADEKLDDCKNIMKENNVEYLNVLPYEGVTDLASEGYPTSYFVDSEGTILTPPVIGFPGDVSVYENAIYDLLPGGTVEAVEAEAGALEEADSSAANDEEPAKAE